MGSKLEPGSFDCYAAAMLDEPMFILLARDDSAPDMLRNWADRRRKAVIAILSDDPDLMNPQMEPQPKDSKAWKLWRERENLRQRCIEDLQKCTEADECAHDMQVWRTKNDGAWRDGDQQRLPLEPLDESLRAAIADEALRCVANVCMCGDAQVVLQEHRITDWSEFGFGIRRHYFRFSSDGHFENLRDVRHPELPHFNVSGHDVRLGDVFCKHKSDSDIRLELQVLEL